MTTIRVLLVDDHQVLRQAVAAMLASEPDIAIAGEAGDGQAGLDAARRLQPDIVVIDLKMPGLGGLAAIGQIAAAVPKAGIIVFTMYDNPAYVWETTNAGASGYVLKSGSRDDLLRAIRAVHAGGGYIQAEVTRPLLRRLAQDARTAGQAAPLTARELEILEHLAEGRANKTIAATLSLSEDTVKAHLKHLYEKLGAADRAHAVALALRQDLIR
ncbi:response regulator [Zavarzinia sp. CC-PAN008]|uniref:response regulator n=1 Tax=Zavarzinia sp. CC-PAN008 TaxID=3243332 RepID=UPI003F74281B